MTFNNGTARQQALFNEALADSLYDWNRISTNVTVEWVPIVPQGHNDFAITTVPSQPVDACGRPSTALIQIRADLDDPTRGGNEGGAPAGTYAGFDFYRETVVHELAHVWQSLLSSQDYDKLLAVLGLNQWLSAASLTALDSTDWRERPQETIAEFFKDVYLPRPYRKFDNRTARPWPRSGFDAFLDVVDNVCPCNIGS